MLKFGLSNSLRGQNIEEILDSMKELGIEYIDLRTIGNKDITDISDLEIKQLKQSIQKNGIKVSSISPRLFFRLPLTKEENEETIRGSFSGHLEMLNRAIELAKMFDVKIIRCFSFKAELDFLFGPSRYKDLPFDIWEKIIERLQKSVRIAENGGVILAIENCYWCNLGTGLLVAKAIKEIKSEHVALWWDPSNSFIASGENPYSDEYEQIKEYIVSIDMKDVIIDKRYNYRSDVVMGKGNKIYWPDILQKLSKDNYQGIINYESNYIPKDRTMIEGTKESFSYIRKILAS